MNNTIRKYLFWIIVLLPAMIFGQINLLDYTGTPDSPADRSSLAFSDQGAWFAYGFPDEKESHGGFSGPFLMTQDNGIWCSKALSRLSFEELNWNDFEVSQTSYFSHLEQVYENKDLRIQQRLFYFSAHTALIVTEVSNKSEKDITLSPKWNGELFDCGIAIERKGNYLHLNSENSNAKGVIRVAGNNVSEVNVSDKSYEMTLEGLKIYSGQTERLVFAQTFIFPEYNLSEELKHHTYSPLLIELSFTDKQLKKMLRLDLLFSKVDETWQDSVYRTLAGKTVLTLQNNTRIPAGELNHAGVFPSYHYKWFHGFWAWDSWKHAVAVAQYDTSLASDQIRAMYDFQTDNGFIPDCIYRDTTIENHNYRNTKPPLSAWAVWAVFEEGKNTALLEELYPKILLQHKWWYQNRDHDQDGICEFGSTDGTLIAAKWESGMDNAVRFDKSQILKNSETAFSLDQESVDLNAYLYAEKIYLAQMAEILGKKEEAQAFQKDAEKLKLQIQNQFFDTESGWFYDTSLDGKEFINAMGCEGWIPLWAKVATKEQAAAVKENMMNPKYFNTKVPFQTLSASHPDFEPDGGYWRGPNWLDQAYFCVMGLRNYGFNTEADEATYKLIHNAEGVLENGKAIRENYNPITGAGLEAQNFSWSAAHYLLLLLEK